MAVSENLLTIHVQILIPIIAHRISTRWNHAGEDWNLQ